jgi:hypothetical protein
MPMLYRFKSHPVSGYYDKTGELVTAETSKSASIKTKAQFKATADCGPGGAGAGSGYGSGTGGAGGSLGSGFGNASQMGGAGGYSSFGGGNSGANVDRYNPVRDFLEEGSVVEDWIPRDASGLNEMFMLMYHRDPYAGTIVDILADTIWSDFDLTGITDRSILKVYEDTMGAIDTLTTMPDITREYLVLGRSISSLIFDSSRGIFKDLVSHDPSTVRLTPIPIKGFDPKIDLIPSPALRHFVDSMDPRDMDARKVLPEAYLQAVRSASSGNTRGGFNQQIQQHAMGTSSMGGIPLDPVNTLFVARKVFNYDMIGTSLYTRLISFWALEKALINASVTSARRRSRSILHVTAGIDNVWEPSAQELDNIAGMFIQADEDPVGAVVTTRTGVSTNEVRQGQDFYKWSDEWTLLTEGKLRALGANDALLSGDATYSNQEAAKTFFMERAANLRRVLTNRIFLKRTFPLIARIHGFVKRSKAELDHRVRITQRESMEIPTSELIMPDIRWRKELVNNVDDKRLEVYEKMEEKGFPITLRNWASASNIDLDDQMSDLNGDVELRKRVQLWKANFDSEMQEDVAKLEMLNKIRTMAKNNVKQVVGSLVEHLGPLNTYAFWDEKAEFCGVNAKVLAEFLKELDPSSNTVRILLDPLALSQRLKHHFKTGQIAEIAHYLLYRTELTPVAPGLNKSTASQISEAIQKSLDKHAYAGNIYQLAKFADKELKIVSSLSKEAKKAAVDKVEKIAQKIGKNDDPIASSSASLYSGKE